MRELACAAAVRCILNPAKYPQPERVASWRDKTNRALAALIRHVDAPDGLADRLADELRNAPHLAHLTANCILNVHIWRKSEIVAYPRHRLLVLTVLKVGSRALLHATRGEDSVRFYSISDAFRKLPGAKDYFSAAFVRHPVSRAISAYRFLRDRQQQHWRRDAWSASSGALHHLQDFSAFCRWLPQHAPRYADRHWAPQHGQIRLPDGSLPDFIGRFETFAQDWERLRSRYPHLPDLPHLNASRSPVPEVGREERRILRQYYAEDFAVFGYE